MVSNVAIHDSEEINIVKQYNTFATEYSQVFVEKNKDSIAAYYKYFEFDLADKTILDLGCGNGYDLFQMKKKGAAVFGIDVSEEMVRLAQQKNPESTIKQGVFDKIPFPNNFFDIVISKWALQNALNMNSVYEEIARVLKIEGKLIYLTSHPIRQFLDKKFKGKDYFKKEMVESVFFDGQFSEKAFSHTMNEYLSPTFFKHFVLLSYEEGFDPSGEQVDGDIYPNYFIINSHRQNFKRR